VPGVLFLDHQYGLGAEALVGSAAIMMHLCGWIMPRLLVFAVTPLPILRGMACAVYLSVRTLGGIFTSVWMACSQDNNLHGYLIALVMTWAISLLGWQCLPTSASLDPQD
jgi:hypothetical protein